MPRARKPTAQHKRDGTYRPDRQGAEAHYPLGAPPMPAEVAGRAAAAAEWRRLVPLLEDQRVITVADVAPLVGYCCALADVLEVERAKGDPDWRPLLVDLVVDGAGVEHRRVKANPLTAQGYKAAHELRQWAIQLGVTPSARAGVTPAPAPVVAETEFDAFRAKRTRGAG